MPNAKEFTVLRVGANKRHFNVQRPIGGGLINEEPEVMVPTSIINKVLESMPNNPSYGIEQAFIELRKIMDTKI